jgi:hypothetical protein
LSTPFINIFNKFNSEVSDADLFSRLTDEELTELLTIFLSKSKSVYFKNCKKDLTNIETYDYYSKTFIATGTSNEFIIDDYPNDPNSDAIEYIVTVEYLPITDFIFDSGTLTFELTSTPIKDDNVVCGYNFSGQFNSDLSDEEQWVLAVGMKLTWLERQLYKEEKLRDKIGTKDYNMSHSPANLIDKLTTLKKETEKELQDLINSYSFNSFEGFN